MVGLDGAVAVDGVVSCEVAMGCGIINLHHRKRGNEKMSDLANLVSTVGFPIVACVFMYKQSNTTLAKVTDAITRLNLTMQRVCDKLDIEMESEENED